MVYKSVITIALICLFANNAYAYEPPSSTCSNDGAHANVYNKTTNSWECVSLSGTSITVPSAGIVVSDGSELSAITDNSTNWDAAYGWGDHALVGYALNSSLGTMASQSAGAVAITGGNILASTITATNFRGSLTGNATTVTNGVYTTDTGSVTNTMLAGSIAQSKLVNSTVTAGSYGSASVVPVITVNAQGLLTAVATAAISGGGSGTVSSGNTGLLAGYTSTGTTVGSFAGSPIYADALGVVADASDHTTSLISALSFAQAQNRCLQLPVGVILATTGTAGGVLTNTCILGQPGLATTLKMPNGANKSVLKTLNADSLWGTASVSGSHNVVLRDIVIDGNRANNTSGNCIDLYGAAPNWENVYAKNCPINMFRTEWGDGDGPGGIVFGMEGSFRHVRGDTSGQHGWRFAGPHDSHMQDVILIDAGMTTTNTYDGVYVEKYGINAEQLHIWRRDGAHQMRYSFNDATDYGPGSIIKGSFFEGAQTAPMYLGQGNWVGAGTVIYPASSGANIPGVIIGLNTNTLEGVQINCDSDKTQVGVQIGTAGGNSSANKIKGTASGCHGGFVNFTYNDGGNNIEMDGYDNGTWPKPYTGTPDGSDTVQFTGNYNNVTFRPFKTPASSTASCTMGELVYNATYIYVCTATNTWKRVTLTTF